MTEYNKDLLLLKGLAAQDSTVVNEIYISNFKIIKSLVLKSGGDEDDAKDIFQESMVVLYQKSISEDFNLTCQLKTYIYSIAKRLIIRRLEAKNKIYVDVDESNLSDQFSFFAENEHLELEGKFEKMNQALQKLGEPCKSLIEAFYIYNKPMQQIATEFNYTNADNAKTQKYKCLMRLKKIFFTD